MVYSRFGINKASSDREVQYRMFIFETKENITYTYICDNDYTILLSTKNIESEFKLRF